MCFCSSCKYEGRIRQAVVTLVQELLPEVEHQELEIMGAVGMNPFRFYALLEQERTALRRQERRCIKVLHACKPLASKLATVAGVYTPLDEAEEQLPRSAPLREKSDDEVWGAVSVDGKLYCCWRRSLYEGFLLTEYEVDNERKEEQGMLSCAGCGNDL